MGMFATFNGGDPWTGMTHAVWGAGWVALFLVVVNSLYGACSAATTVSTRMLMSLGRSGLSPRPLGQMSRRSTPSNALAVVGVAGLALALWLGLQYGPVTGLSIMVVTSTSLYIIIYILVNIGCMGYFLRHRRDDLHWLKHVVVPLVGAVVFVPVLLVQFGIPAFSFISRLRAPLTYGAYAAVAIVIVASAAAVYFAITSPEGLSALGTAFDEAAHGGQATPEPPVGLAAAQETDPE
jgi:amino acid transporter